MRSKSVGCVNRHRHGPIATRESQIRQILELVQRAEQSFVAHLRELRRRKRINTMSQERDDSVSFASDANDSFNESVNGSASTQHEGDEMNTTQKDQVKEVQEMAKKETNNMRFWKAVVCLTILAIATVVSTGTWIFLKSEEDSNYEDSYTSFADTIRNAVQIHKRDLFLTIRGCSDSISGAAIATNSEFPFVTVPTFEIFGHSVRQQSGAEAIVYTPKVEVDELTRWQEYATVNEGWYEESKMLALSSGDNTLVQSDYVLGNISAVIYDPSQDQSGNLIAAPPANPPFYPMWQVSPPPFTPFPLKANLASYLNFVDNFKTVNIVREGVLGQTVIGTNALGESVLKQADHTAFHDQFVSSDVEASAFERPHAFLFQPVFREAFNDTSDIVGTVNALVPWDRYFANLLPEGVKGITGVLQNTCGLSFTYYLDGNKVSCSQLENERAQSLEVVGKTLTLFPIFSTGVLCWRGRHAR
jgi:hypothetical protein